MTACVNKKHRAVVAALAGAMALSVPAVALATPAIDTLAVSTEDAFAKGTVAAENGNGEEVVFPAKDMVSFTTASGDYLLPTSITVAGDKIDLNLKAGSGNAIVKYYSGAITNDSSQTSVAEVGLGAQPTKLAKNHDWAAGTYTAVIEFKKDGSLYKGMKKYVSFKIVDANLADATLFNATGDNTDASKNTFTYNGSAQKVGLTIDGAVLKADDYDIVLYKGATKQSGDTVTDAGAYTAYIYKNNEGASGVAVKTINFSVAKLDLSKAVVTINDVAEGGAVPTTAIANGVSISNGTDSVSVVASSGTSSPKGRYSATVAAGESSTNFVGSTTVSFNVVTNVVSSGYKYNKTPFSTLNGSADGLVLDLAKGESLDEELITVDDVDSKLFDVTYTDALTGAAVDLSALSKPGTYRVTVRVNAERTDYAKGGMNSFKVTVKAPVVSTDDVVFKFKGEVTSNLSEAKGLPYDGTDFLKEITASVTYGKKALVEGTDYTVVVLDESGKKVDSIIDAGTYTVEVRSDTYKVEGGVLNVEVKPVAITYLYAKSTLMQTFGTTTVIPWTGEELEPAFTFGYYVNEDGNPVKYDADEDLTWVDMPAEAVRIDGIKYGSKSDAVNTVVDGLKDAGFYEVYVDLNDDVVNYEISTLDGSKASNKVEVSKKGVFSDVATGEWYSEGIYQAKSEGYINGLRGTTLFAPDRNITRGDVAVVLMNMATPMGPNGKEEVSSDKITEYIGYATEFGDVDTSMYYAAAIGWASDLGIVNGYGDGTFRPDQNITREEFACMLANYAIACGDKVVEADGDALAKLPDADKASSWAVESLEWAVDQKIMGNGGTLDAASPITRAMVACMAVNYQPESPSNSDLL